MPNIFHGRRLAWLIGVCILLAGVLVGLQVWINHMDEHEPFRRVGLPDPNISLQKTLEWIDSTIQGTHVYYSAQLQGDTSVVAVEKYEKLSYDGCDINVKVVDLTFDTLGYQMSFNLLDLLEIGRPIKMVYGDKTQWKVPLQTVGSREVMQDRIGAASYTSLTVSDPAMAQRLVNALNHAIRLCRKMMKPSR